MFIPDPVFYPSRIPDPKTAMKGRGKKIYCKTFFLATNFTKKELPEVFYQKIVNKLSKIWVWDPGSGSGSRIQRSKMHRPGSATLF
jgi:hypothetical protein